MNSNNFNVALFNEVVTDSVQRVSTAFTVAAVLRPTGRVRRRAPMVSTPTATMGTLWKVLTKSGATAFAPAAAISILGSHRSRTKLQFVQAANITHRTTVYPRRNISQGVVRVVPYWDGALGFKTLRPAGKLTAAPNVVMQPSLAKSYQKFRTKVTFTMRTRISVTGETVKQIPYDEDAPDIRVMVVPYQNREMRVA